MQFKIRVYLDGQLIEPSMYKNVHICCSAVDKIVNHIYEINHMDDQLDLSDDDFDDEEDKRGA